MIPNPINRWVITDPQAVYSTKPITIRAKTEHDAKLIALAHWMGVKDPMAEVDAKVMADWLAPGGLEVKLLDSVRWYGQWSGNPKGIREDETRCAEQIMPKNSMIFKQCHYKRGHGANGLLCRHHAKQAG